MTISLAFWVLVAVIVALIWGWVPALIVLGIAAAVTVLAGGLYR